MFKAANATVMVSDIDRAISFYTSVLGLPAGIRHGDNYAEVHAPGVVIGLHPARGNSATVKQGNLSIGLQVEDIQRAVKQLSSKGVSFKTQENEANKFAFFSDPDGTPLYLLQPKN